MTRGQTGGALLVAGSIGLALLVLDALAVDASKALEVGSLVVLGLGAGVVAFDERPFRAALLGRAGLTFAALGLLGLGVSETAFALSPDRDPLASPFIVVELVCLLAFLVGQVAVGSALTRKPGVGALGVLFLGGLAALVFGAYLAWHGPEATDTIPVTRIAALAGGVSVIVGWAGLGLLRLRRVDVRPAR